MVIGLASQLIINTLIGQASGAVWGMINTLQLINYCAMMTLYYPKIVLQLFSFISFINMENKGLSMIFLLHFDKSPIKDRNSNNYRFKNQGVGSTNILINWSDIFMVVLIIFFNYGLFHLLSIWFRKPTAKKVDNSKSSQFKPKKSCCIKFYEGVTKYVDERKKEFFFNTLLRLIFEIFLDILFASLYHINNIKWGSSVDTYSNIVAFVWASILILSWLFTLLYFIFTNSNSLHEFSKSRFTILFKDFKKKKVCLLDSFLFLTRRGALVFILLFIENQGLYQSILFLCIWAGVLVYKAIVRPFKSMILNAQELIFECILLIIIAIMITFKNPTTELVNTGRPLILGIILFTLAVSIIIINYIFSITLSVKTWKSQKRERQLGRLQNVKTTSVKVIEIKNTLKQSTNNGSLIRVNKWSIIIIGE